MEWNERNEWLKNFESSGFLHNNACGVIEDDDSIIFFLGEGEEVNALALEFMWDWGFDNDLTFVGVTFEVNPKNIPTDEWYISQLGDLDKCLKVVFRKGRWKDRL